jgi:hypothetical protein
MNKNSLLAIWHRYIWNILCIISQWDSSSTQYIILLVTNLWLVLPNTWLLCTCIQTNIPQIYEYSSHHTNLWIFITSNKSMNTHQISRFPTTETNILQTWFNRIQINKFLLPVFYDLLELLQMCGKPFVNVDTRTIIS